MAKSEKARSKVKKATKQARKAAKLEALARARSILYEHFDPDAVLILVSHLNKKKESRVTTDASGNYYACIGVAKHYLEEKGEL